MKLGDINRFYDSGKPLPPEFEKLAEILIEAGIGANSIQTANSGCKAEGVDSVAIGDLSRTVNDASGAIEDWREGKGAFATGGNTMAGGNYSFTSGNSTVTNNPYEVALGHFNKSHFVQAVYPSAGNTLFSIGIGSNIENAKNAIEIMQNGDVYIIGVGGYDGTNPDTAQTLQEILGSL